MTIEQIRAASARDLADTREDAHEISETTPSSVTEDIKNFICSFSSDNCIFVPVVDDDLGFYGWCSDGVAEKVKIAGGRPVYGWTIWEWPNVILTAEFHCVWQDPGGALVDITPKPKREPRILFVPDPSVPIDFDFDLRPGNKRTRSYVEADRASLARAKALGLNAGQRAYEERRAAKNGLSLEDWLEAKLPVDPLPSAIDDWIKACNAHEAYFDTLGGAGQVTVDAKLIAFMRERVAAQTKFKALLRA